MQQVKVGIIGAGNIAAVYDTKDIPAILTHAHAILEDPTFMLSGFFDADPARAKEAAGKWDTDVFPVPEELIERSDIVVLAVPDKYHAEYLMKLAAVSGLKAIITEKPLTSTMEEAESVMNAWRGQRVPVFVNYSRRYMDAFADLKRWIREEAGDLLLGCCYYGKGIMHNGSHMVNLLLNLLGDLTVSQVEKGFDDHTTEDPSASVCFRIPGNERAEIWFHPIPSNVVTVFDFELFFEHGKVICSGEEETLRYERVGESALYQGEKNYQADRCVPVDTGSAMPGLYRNVEEVLEGRGVIRCGLEDAFRTLKICEEIRNSVFVA